MNSWIKNSIFYHIYPLGFCGAPASNNSELNNINRIKKVIEWIPHLKALGINALYIGPLFESSTHGYDTIDYYTIDSRLGTNADFKEVCCALHENNIKIILDGVFNHVGREFFAFKDLLQYGKNSKYINWFSNIRFDNSTPYKDNFSYDSWEGHYELVKLNLKNPEVKDHIFKAIDCWIKEFDIDGLRLDAANCLDMDFLKELSSHCKNQKEDFWLMGEVIHGDYNLWANKDMLDSITNYECYKGIYSSLNEKNYFEINYSLNRQSGNYGIYKNIYLYNFVDNHDVARLASILNNPNHIYLAYTLLFTMPGVPSIYYGSEWGILGKKEKISDASLRPELDLHELINNPPDKKLSPLITKLSKIRLNSPALKEGNYKEVLIRNDQLIFARTFEDETILAVLNLSDKEISFNFNSPVSGTYLLDLLNDNKKYEIVNGTIYLNLSPYCAKILKIY